jgi:hypothetical protein
VITSYEEFEANHAQAMRNRTTAPTLLNAHSSRSHFMVIIKVHMMQQALLRGMHARRLDDITSNAYDWRCAAQVTRREAGTGRVYVGTLMLVDLAGSEDNRRTGNIVWKRALAAAPMAGVLGV